MVSVRVLYSLFGPFSVHFLIVFQYHRAPRPSRSPPSYFSPTSHYECRLGNVIPGPPMMEGVLLRAQDWCGFGSLPVHAATPRGTEVTAIRVWGLKKFSNFQFINTMH